MSIDILSKDILLEAQNKKQILEDELKEEFFKSEKNLKNELEIFKSNLKTKFNNDLIIEKEKIIGSAKKDANKIILETKNKLLKQVFNETLESLNNLNKYDRELSLKLRLNSASKLMKFQKIICSKKDLTFIKSIVDKNVEVKLEDDIEGLKFIGNSGKEILDFTNLTIIREAYENIEDKLQTILFGI